VQSIPRSLSPIHPRSAQLPVESYTPWQRPRPLLPTSNSTLGYSYHQVWVHQQEEEEQQQQWVVQVQVQLRLPRQRA